MKHLIKRLIAMSVLACATWNVQAQCPDPDTVTNNTVTLITATTARVNGTQATPTANQTIVLRYVRSGFTDTVSATGSGVMRNLTGLSPSTLYKYYYRTLCSDGRTDNQASYYTFTTLTSTVLYVAERPTVFQYLKTDTGGIAFVPSDTLEWRTPTDLAIIKYKSSNSTFYGYYPSCLCWRPLATDSAGIIAQLDLKVDSVTVSGDSLFWWNDHGVSHGYVLPALANVWKLDASNTGAGRSLGTSDANDVTFKTNGVERMRLTSAGKVGIFGSPTYNFDITKAVGSEYLANISNSDVSGSGLRVYVDNITDTLVDFISSSGSRFKVLGNGAIQFNGTAGTSGYLLKSTGSGTPPTWTNPTSIVTATPTLALVVAEGNNTTDSINVLASNGVRLVSLHADNGGGGNRDGAIRLNHNTLVRYTILNDASLIFNDGTYQNVIDKSTSISQNSTINLPDSSGVPALRVSLNGTTYNANDKGTIALGTTGTVTGTGTANEISYWTGTTAIGSLTTATYPSLTELSYVKGVTSAVQTQLNARLQLAGGTMTGNLLFTDNTYDIGASGATRPRTGYFGTSIFNPLLIGGTGTTSTLTYKTTTGVGTTGADHIFQVGNNGATEAMRITNVGNVNIGTTLQASPSFLDVGNGATNIMQVGVPTNGAYIRYITSDNYFAAYDTRAHAVAASNVNRGTYVDWTKVGLNSAAFVGFTSGSDAAGSPNVTLSRNAAGILQVGTTAANANGTLVAATIGIGTTSPSAKLHTISTTEQLRLGYDASNYISNTVSSAGVLTIAPTGASITVTKPIVLQGYTVATLPTGVTGMTAYVTDATAPTYNAALVGGGAVVVPVFYNGAAWVSH